jgi:hypothetical protein
MPTNVDIRGLDRRGFRIKNAGGSQAAVKKGSGTVSVDIDDAKVAQQLIRNKSQWVRASSDSVTVRGLTSTNTGGSAQPFAGFRGGSANTLTIGTSNAAVTYAAKSNSSGTIRVAHVVSGGTVARSIVVSGNDITVNPATTAGAVNGSETATAIAAAVNANASASALVTATAGGTGASVVVAGALAALAGGATARVRAGTGAAVNIADAQEARRLRRNRANFIVGSSNLISIKGLDDRGFRVKNSGGTLAMVKRGGAAVTVNVDDGNVQRVLREHNGHWIEA